MQDVVNKNKTKCYCDYFDGFFDCYMIHNIGGIICFTILISTEKTIKIMMMWHWLESV